MKNLMAALLKAQSEFGAVRKDGKNPAFHSSYATLGSVQDAAMPALIANGIVCYQDARTTIDEGGRITVFVGTMLFHVQSGEQINQELGLVPAKQDPQGVGSAITYGRRYGLMTALGLSPDDDDGNSSAAQRPPAQARPANDGYSKDVAFAPKATPAPAMPDEKLTKQFHAVGTELYPKKGVWDAKRPGLVSWATGKRTNSSTELTAEEMSLLIEKMSDELRKGVATEPELMLAQ